MRLAQFYYFLLFCCIGCSSAHSTLHLADLHSYDKTASDHIIFLNFKITGSTGKTREKVVMVQALSGTGKMKNLTSNMDYPSHIKVIKKYVNGQHTESFYQHPLIKQTEVSTPDGRMNKVVESSREGTFFIRFQEDKSLEEIELYSVTPEKGTRKIYTVTF